MPRFVKAAASKHRKVPVKSNSNVTFSASFLPQGTA
jgi:hypothetical protein